MTKEELLTILHDEFGDDVEVMHIRHDEALLAYINDPEITAAYESQGRWYA